MSRVVLLLPLRPSCAVCLQVVLFESEVINEWLEEQYPHPAMLPQQPLARAQVRACNAGRL